MKYWILNSFMSDLFDSLAQRFESFSDSLSKNGKKYFQSVLSKGKKIGHQGKVQIEIEKLKWELKQKYNDLGQYVAEKKISRSVTDFSHDKQFLEFVIEVNKIKIYIDERQQERGSRDSKLQAGQRR